MSSLAQDEIGHAQALYALLADLTDIDPDALAYDRAPEDYRHCRLLDHGRGDWAMTIARRFERAPFAPQEVGDPDMGLAADLLAEERGVSRARQDEYAARSHARAAASVASGAFDAETVPVAGVRNPETGIVTLLLPVLVVTSAKPSKIDRSRSGAAGFRYASTSDQPA